MMRRVPRDLGISGGTATAPNATRVARPGWRDPRLWIGVLLVTGSVVAGARLLAAADDTVTVWSMTEERGAGTPVVADDLVATRVRFNDDETLDRYFPADEPVPEDLVLDRAVGSGELLARSAIRPRDEEKVLQVPLAVDPQRVPPDVRSGSVVDVWVSDSRSSASAEEAGGGATQDGEDKGAKGADRLGDAPALAGVTVVAAPPFDETFAVSGTRQLVVVVDESTAADFEAVLGSLQDPVIRVLQRS